MMERQLRDSAKGEAGALKTWRRFSTDVPSALLTNERIAAEAAKYRAFLMSLITQVNGRGLPYPATPHEELALRAIQRRRPFDDKGSGYRDSLIWGSVLDLLREDSKAVWFVSEDRAFWEGESSQLAGDLRADLRGLGLDDTAVLPFRRLADLGNGLLRPRLRILETNDLGFPLAPWFREKLPGILSGDLIWLLFLYGIDGSHFDVGGIAVSAIKDEQVERVRTLPSGGLLAQCSALVTLTFFIGADGDRYYRWEDVRWFFGSSISTPTDPQTEGWTIQVGSTEDVRVGLDVLVEGSVATGSLAGFEPIGWPIGVRRRPAGMPPA